MKSWLIEALVLFALGVPIVYVLLGAAGFWAPLP